MIANERGNHTECQSISSPQGEHRSQHVISFPLFSRFHVVLQLIHHPFFFIYQPLVSRHDELRERARQLLEQARNTKSAGLVSAAASPIEVLFYFQFYGFSVI